MDRGTAIKQLNELKRLGKNLRLAADEWDEDWKTLIATLMSARTTDRVTIPLAEKLFKSYDNLAKLANADEKEIGKIINGVNFYETKAKRIIELAKILVSNYKGEVPHDFSKLIELPGVGRKTANVFLAEKGFGRIGVDTHVDYISHYLGWTNEKTQEKVERDLENLFPKEYWGEINWTLVKFGQTYPNRTEKNKILDEIKRMR